MYFGSNLGFFGFCFVVGLAIIKVGSKELLAFVWTVKFRLVDDSLLRDIRLLEIKVTLLVLRL
jgi:hypothetical protein